MEDFAEERRDALLCGVPFSVLERTPRLTPEERDARENLLVERLRAIFCAESPAP